jgi:hypothetical protein
MSLAAKQYYQQNGNFAEDDPTQLGAFPPNPPAAQKYSGSTAPE